MSFDFSQARLEASWNIFLLRRARACIQRNYNHFNTKLDPKGIAIWQRSSLNVIFQNIYKIFIIFNLNNLSLSQIRINLMRTAFFLMVGSRTGQFHSGPVKRCIGILYYLCLCCMLAHPSIFVSEQGGERGKRACTPI